MNKANILVIGGYGNVGAVVSQLLADGPSTTPIIAGRNQTRAQALAEQLGGDWRRVDIRDEVSIRGALEGVQAIINCFSGPFTGFPLLLPRMAADAGVHYVDVAGSYEYADRFLKLHAAALQHQATLITALGANPGIPGLLVMASKEDFDHVTSAKIVFVLGADVGDISPASLKEMKHMFDVKPLAWKAGQWAAPQTTSDKMFIGKPFNKNVYLGASLTRDLLCIPDLLGLDALSFWSGAQSTLQGLTMIWGMQAGLTKSDRSARFLLRVLQQLGKTRGASKDVYIGVELEGTREGKQQRMLATVIAEENYATALAPALVCQQIVENVITTPGAFVAPQVVPASDFKHRMIESDVQYAAQLLS